MQIPEGVELMTDLTAAGWIEERLALWPQGPGFPVRSVVPDAFEAYARVFHPAWRGEVPVIWSEIANEGGRVMHPAMSFEALVGSWSSEPGGVQFPLEEMREEECVALAAALAEFTSSPERCWCCVWAGYGFLGGGAQLTYSAGSARDLRRMRRQARKRARREQSELDRIPKVETLRDRPDRPPARQYLLFRGSLEAITNMRFGRSFQAPNIWWPDDRAWCVATEVDGYDTFVGGSRACIHAVLRSPNLEALEVRPDQRVDAYADTLNPPPSRPSG